MLKFYPKKFSRVGHETFLNDRKLAPHIFFWKISHELFQNTWQFFVYRQIFLVSLSDTLFTFLMVFFSNYFSFYKEGLDTGFNCQDAVRRIDSINIKSHYLVHFHGCHFYPCELLFSTYSVGTMYANNAKL